MERRSRKPSADSEATGTPGGQQVGGRKTTPGLWRKFEYVMMSMYLGKKPFGFYDGD